MKLEKWLEIGVVGCSPFMAGIERWLGRQTMLHVRWLGDSLTAAAMEAKMLSPNAVVYEATEQERRERGAWLPFYEQIPLIGVAPERNAVLVASAREQVAVSLDELMAKIIAAIGKYGTEPRNGKSTMKKNGKYRIKRRSGKRIVIGAVALCALLQSPLALASTIGGAVVDSAKPPVQQTERKNTELKLEEPAKLEPVKTDEQERFAVREIRLRGELPLPEAEVRAFLALNQEREMTLELLNELCAGLTQFMRKAGFIVAFAYVPPQDLQDGAVEIVVVPGKYGSVRIKGDAHVEAAWLKNMFFSAQEGSLIRREPLERSLLLVRELSGLSARATLLPGSKNGTADLEVTVEDGDKWDGMLYADNWGNRNTGIIRYGVQSTLNNFSGHGDSVTLGGLTTGQGITNYNLGYSANFGYDGAKIELKYSRVDYALGERFAALGASGNAQVSSLNLSYPLVRSRSFSLFATAGYEHKELRDDMTGVSSFSPRTEQLWKIGLAGRFEDQWLGGSANSVSITQNWGSLALGNATTAAIDEATARTGGTFSKTVFNWQRQQYLLKNVNFNLTVSGQLATKNLDSAEKLYLGGADGVRAFAQGEGAGDQGYLLSGEFRWLVPGLSKGANNLFLNAFYDYGSVMINKRPYSSEGNRRSLMGAGIGLLWTRSGDFSIRLDYARKIGGEPTTADDGVRERFWLQGVKYL